MSIILGIHSGHESSAVVFKNGGLLAAISEERLTRIKNDGERVPDRSIDKVLEMAGISRADVDRLALLYTFFPEEYFIRETFLKEAERKLSRLRRRLKGEKRPLILLENLLTRLLSRGKHFDDHFLQKKMLKGEKFDALTNVRFYDHHDAHALPAAYYSGFERAAVFTMDGNGDFNISHTSSIYESGRLNRLYASSKLGTSAGLFYSHITRLLGFMPLRHEGKVIGLAAYGDPSILYKQFSKALRLSPDGRTLDSDFAGLPDAETNRYNFLKEAITGHSREDISAAAQQVLEDVVLALVRNFLSETGADHVALNGGVFANVKLNQRISELPEVKEVFIFPAMSDTGNSIGAVLLDLMTHDPQLFDRMKQPLDSVYWGPEYDKDYIEAELINSGLHFSRKSEDEILQIAAGAIHSGQVVGWFQGRMEFGPRALGNRSILARPTDVSINDWLNKRLERSEFMPFAPSVLEEHADEIFIGVEKARRTAAFMTITFDVRSDWRSRIPAVVHIDGTSRPQLVTKKANPLYHKLIRTYYEMSGIPLVLNTSFNVHEEPIVCSPKEAIKAFMDKRVDCLAIDRFWLEH